MSGLFDLTGRTALVTGSTRGLGLALARGLAGAGARVAVNGRKRAACEAVLWARRGTGPLALPEAGMQPMCGRKLVGRLEPPVEDATKTAARDVETPGLTGLPSLPMKATSIARLLSSLSSPPTM